MKPALEVKIQVKLKLSLVGAGRTETLRHMFGLDQAKAGSIMVGGSTGPARPAARMRAGLGIVSEDRKGEGLAQNLSIADNLSLSHLSPYSAFGLLNLRKRSQAMQEWMQRLAVKAKHADQPISALSGGNQQKVAIARVLHQDANVLLLDEPTRGIDVATKADIYRLIGELALSGKAVIFVSSYLPELTAICDTIGVMSRGKLREVKPTAQWSENEILSVAVTA